MAGLRLRLLLPLLLLTAAAAQIPAQPPPPKVDGVLARKEVIKKPCSYDKECPRHAYCKMQRECACKEDYFIHKDEARSEVCLKRVLGEGDGCTEAAQCRLALGPSAECRAEWGGAVCRCADWAHEVDGRCYNTSRVGERCVAKNNCRILGGPTLTCASGLCVCPRLQHGSADGWRCLDDRRLGEDCQEDEECVTSNSHCMGVCECRVQYVTNDRNKRCLKVAAQVGDMCDEDLQCNRFIPDSECARSGQCECRDGYHPGPRGVRCWRSSFLGEPCGDDLECVATRLPLVVPYNATLAECVGSRCQCLPGYVPDESGLRCVEGAAARPALSGAALLAAAVAALAAGCARR